MNTIYAELIAGREELGGYVKYVFRNLENGKPILCTKFPNWDCPPIKLHTAGYLKYKEIIAGKDTWYDHANDVFRFYKYDADQFIDFVEAILDRDAEITI